MKKGIAILLLLSFTVQITGYHLFFHIKKSQIKRSVRQRIRRIESEQTETFVLSLADAKSKLQWEEDDEFRFNGELYDLVDQKTENGKVYIRCISDKKETNLVRNYKSAARDDFGDKSSKKASQLTKLFGSFFSPLAGTTPAIPVYSSANTWFTYETPLVSQSREIITPPPQAA